MMAEVRVEPGDMPSGDVLGFMNISAWASSEEGFVERVRAYLAKYRWELLSHENARTVDPDRDYGDEANALIDQVRGNEEYIGLGTYYSYKPE